MVFETFGTLSVLYAMPGFYESLYVLVAAFLWSMVFATAKLYFKGGEK